MRASCSAVAPKAIATVCLVNQRVCLIAQDLRTNQASTLTFREQLHEATLLAQDLRHPVVDESLRARR